MKKRILYIISIDWDFIKQRPQFIAESLSQYYEIDVVERKGIRHIFNFKSFRKRPIASNITLQGVFLPMMAALAFLEKTGLIDWFNGMMMRLSISRLNSYDYIYVGNSSSYKVIRKVISKNTTLIYDCMDDEKEFPSAQSIVQYNPVIEKELLHRADYVFCTSAYLKQKLMQRNQIEREIFTIPNAIGLPTDAYPRELPEQLKIVEKLDHVLLYIGAIAPWFDFDTLLYCLEKNPHVHVVLVGPVLDLDAAPQHPRIHYLGSCEHRYIYALMDKAQILTMPFVVNELIKSVNPVKLYEYIYSGKPIVATHYGETEHFADYVYLYDTPEEYSEIVSDLINKDGVNKKEKQACRAYAAENTWQCRVKNIHTILGDRLK